jgi:tetratricopeptide (TPR) repeat protein
MLFPRHTRRKAVEGFRQGKLAADRGDCDLAFSWFNEAIRLDPALDLGFFGRGFICLKKEDYGRAIIDFSEALRLSPDSALYYFYRSLAYEGKGESARQWADYDRAVSLDPTLEKYIASLWDPSPLSADEGAQPPETGSGRPSPGGADQFFRPSLPPLPSSSRDPAGSRRPSG